MAPKGFLMILLHFHLPFVRHPEQESYLEEQWLFEAITDSYIPLLAAFEKLVEEGKSFPLALSISPPLLSMLTDPLLQSRYLLFLESRLQLAQKEMTRTVHNAPLNSLVKFYRKRFLKTRDHFLRWEQNLIKPIKDLSRQGGAELLTTSATHAYLPLFMVNPSTVRAQLLLAAEQHQRVFGEAPQGLWLPECGYTEKMEPLIKEAGFSYFFLDSHGIYKASPPPLLGTYGPLYTPLGLTAFGRDREASKEVWCAESGFPGDPWYRDFYRDIGFDLPKDQIADYVQEEGQGNYTGFKYYRITGRKGPKSPYSPVKALEKVREHSTLFLRRRREKARALSVDLEGVPPLFFTPFDAELLGHWWFEGPQWLYALLSELSQQEEIKLIPPGHYLKERPIHQISRPATSSWGEGGYNAVWLDDSNKEVYPPLHQAAAQLTKMAKNRVRARGVPERALNQAARELLLAQSSDWTFMIRNGHTADYAVSRIKGHLQHFDKIIASLEEGTIDEQWLRRLEEKNNIFPSIDFRIFGGS